MNTTILFNNATAFAAADGADLSPTMVPDGRVAAFNADNYAAGTLSLTAPLADTGVKRVQFVQGVPAGKSPVMSSVIEVKDVEKVFTKAYVAPVAQVTTVTTGVAAGTVIVRVIRTDAGFKPHERVTVEVNGTGLTDAQLTDALVAKLNAARPRFYTASNAGDNLAITADIHVSFQTALDGLASDWAITASTTPTFGSGTPAQVAEIEKYAYGANFQNRIYLPVNPDSYAANLNYALHQIFYKTNTTANISNSNEFHQLILAGQHASTGIDLAVMFGPPTDLT